MDEPAQPPSIPHLTELIVETKFEDAAACLDRYEAAGADDRKRALRALYRIAADRPPAVTGVLTALTHFLTDQERSVRLTTAKLFVAVSEADPDAVVPVGSSLADRLADEDEFYYVRARSAEALGYIALENPDEVVSPDILADLIVGLSFDEPEVKDKLAKAIEYVALGTPSRLRHRVSDLANHLDDTGELVRYHLCTALAVVACEYPESLSEERTVLRARLDDTNAYVRGRAAEALGLTARGNPEETTVLTAELKALQDDREPFVAERARFATSTLTGSERTTVNSDGIGSIEAIRETTDDTLAEITSPDGMCTHCGLALPECGPPMCPECGAPY